MMMMNMNEDDEDDEDDEDGDDHDGHGEDGEMMIRILSPGGLVGASQGPFRMIVV